MPQTEDIHPYQWLDIDDFSPGAFSHDGTVGYPVDRRIPAPRGAHDPANSFACIALPGGGIGALPGVTATYTWPGSSIVSGNTFVTGFFLHDELQGVNSGTEAIIIDEWDDGVNHHMQAGSYVIETTTFNQIVATTNTTATGIFGSPYIEATRMSTANPATAPFHPVIVWPSGGPAQAAPAIGQVYVYPNPSAPTLFPPFSLISGSSSVAGQLLVHQGRVLVLAAQTYSWPTGTTNVFTTNDNINFTDPSLTTSLGIQLEILAPEEPYGYGAGGSQSAGELFLVKKRGGGVIATGDISNPSVTILPGVASTGNMFGRGASTPIGFVYGSFDNGLWTWNGSNTSSKLSAQLDDGFFLPFEFTGSNGYPNMVSNNYGFYVNTFGDRIYVSNNWLFDIKSNSWWKYYPDAAQGGTQLFYVQPVNGNFIYCSVLSFPNSNKTFMYRFDPATPAQQYQWTSLPLNLATQDRVSDIREVVVRASSTVGTNNEITLTIADQGVTVFTNTKTNIGTGPQLLRWGSIGATGLQSPQVQVNVQNTGPSQDMPIVHSIHLHWKPRAHIASVI
jgi:hypothetical protein